jgi:hypothetical protein
MIPARDTFLYLLADNLASPVVVHHVRQDPDNPGNQRLQTNAVNVQFLNDGLHTVVSDLRVAIDVIHEDERTAIDWTKQVWAILSAALYTPIFDYSSGTPVLTGHNLSWVQPVSFRPVFDELYTRRGCVLTLQYHF